MTTQEWTDAAIGLIGGFGGGLIAAFVGLYLWDATKGWRR